MRENREFHFVSGQVIRLLIVESIQDLNFRFCVHTYLLPKLWHNKKDKMKSNKTLSNENLLSKIIIIKQKSFALRIQLIFQNLLCLMASMTILVKFGYLNSKSKLKRTLMHNKETCPIYESILKNNLQKNLADFLKFSIIDGFPDKYRNTVQFEC